MSFCKCEECTIEENVGGKGFKKNIRSDQLLATKVPALSRRNCLQWTWKTFEIFYALLPWRFRRFEGVIATSQLNRYLLGFLHVGRLFSCLRLSEGDIAMQIASSCSNPTGNESQETGNFIRKILP